MADEFGNNLKLRFQQEKFCQEYVQDFNGGAAYMRAGYEVKDPLVASACASRLLNDAKVQDKIRELMANKMAAANVTTELVLRELKAIATADPDELFDAKGALKPIKDIPPALRKNIKEITINELFEGQGKDREHVGYTKTIKLWSKDKALENLGRYLKMFVERHEHTGKLSLEQLVAGGYEQARKQSESEE